MAVTFCGSLQAAEITAVPLKDRDGLILIRGELKLDDKDTFLAKAAPFSGGIVILESPGGSAFAGIEIGREIRRRGLTTWVESGTICASACAIAWLGGERRVMGKAAVIGFHAISIVKDGERVETGLGNAMYGAYLAKLGLSDRAIEYLADAAPSSMNWLTPSDAENIGIKLTVYDEKPTGPRRTPPETAPSVAAPSVPPAAAPGIVTANIEARSRDFVIALNVVMSGPSEQYLKVLDGLYADPVLYFGKQMQRTEVVTQLTKFIERWPDRSYVVRPESLKVQCDNAAAACHISGLIDFSAKSVARNQWSRGTASFDYVLAFRPDARWPVIVNENGGVVNLQMNALHSLRSRYPQEFDASQR